MVGELRAGLDVDLSEVLQPLLPEVVGVRPLDGRLPGGWILVGRASGSAHLRSPIDPRSPVEMHRDAVPAQQERLGGETAAVFGRVEQMEHLVREDHIDSVTPVVGKTIPNLRAGRTQAAEMLSS